MNKPLCACGANMSRNSKQCRTCQRRGNTGARRSAETRARLSAAASARWERRRGGKLDRAAIAARIQAGDTIEQIAEDLKTTRTTISVVLNYGSWAEYRTQQQQARESAPGENNAQHKQI